jgi:hypothetical protein
MEPRSTEKPKVKRRAYSPPRVEEDEVFERRALGGCAMENVFQCPGGPYEFTASG